MLVLEDFAMMSPGAAFATFAISPLDVPRSGDAAATPHGSAKTVGFLGSAAEARLFARRAQLRARGRSLGAGRDLLDYQKGEAERRLLEEE
jgi:hypothetical protein